MEPVVDLFWSFRSPYSYLATPEARELTEQFPIKLRFRPVLPLAVRDPEFFNPDNIKRARYIMIDWVRRAQELGMEAKWPSPDPIVQDLANFTIAEDQPLIYRLTYLGIEAELRGRGIQFAYEVSHLLFGGTENWHEGEHLAEAAARAGLDLAEMEAVIADPSAHQKILEENHEALKQSSHWGVPTFLFNGEPFFGQDRISTLRWRLAQHFTAAGISP
jgi:2-hydroxychromene-2-carboxylate isomerase